MQDLKCALFQTPSVFPPKGVYSTFKKGILMIMDSFANFQLTNGAHGMEKNLKPKLDYITVSIKSLMMINL